METVTGTCRSVARQVVPPATRLEHMLYPWVYFGILPLFALTNADVSFARHGRWGRCSPRARCSSASSSVLLVGKPHRHHAHELLGGEAEAGQPARERQLACICWAPAILGGVGFTMAIFVANLAFADAVLVATAKLGILLASLAAGVLGFTFLLVQARGAQKQGVAFVDPAVEGADGDLEALPTAAREAALEGREMLHDLEADEELDPRGVA